MRDRIKRAVMMGLPDRDERRGQSVALSADGSTLAVGAPREDSAATGIGIDQVDNDAGDAGAVYVCSAREWLP